MFGVLADLRLLVSLPSPIRRKVMALRRNDIVVDVGANVGSVSRLFARRGASVFSFEPDPLAFAALLKKARGARRIFPIPFAAGVENTSSRLYVHEHRDDDPLGYTSGSSLLGEKPNVSSESFEVAQVDLAGFLGLFSRIAALKIDIEGFEVELIPYLIAQKALNNVESVFVETHDRKWPELEAKTQTMFALVQENNLGSKFHFDWP